PRPGTGRATTVSPSAVRIRAPTPGPPGNSATPGPDTWSPLASGSASTRPPIPGPLGSNAPALTTRLSPGERVNSAVVPVSGSAELPQTGSTPAVHGDTRRPAGASNHSA